MVHSQPAGYGCEGSQRLILLTAWYRQFTMRVILGGPIAPPVSLKKIGDVEMKRVTSNQLVKSFDANYPPALKVQPGETY